MPILGDLIERTRDALPPAGRRVVRAGARTLTAATRGIRVLPDFLVIGTQRGGTTTLYHYLVRHPQVLGAVLDKEVHFFDRRYHEGIDAYRGAFPTRWTVARAGRHAPVVVGEATPYYLFHPVVPERVAEALPDVRLIAVLRDPIERAWSQYRHEVDLGYEDLRFEAALDREEERLQGEEDRLRGDPGATSFAHQHHAYVARGRYAEQLERWYRAFPPDRLLLLRSEDLMADPAAVFREAIRSLGVAPWEPPAWRALNAATAGSMRPETRERLRDLYRPWNERLAALTGRDWGW